MTIASELTKLNTNLGAAYTAVDDKGGTLPQARNFDNLATAIASIPSGSSPVITTLSVTPTTSSQTITAPSGTDGYSPVNVAAVTAAIDSNITAGNIKSGVTILGVTGNYEGSGGGGIGIPREVKNGVYQTPTKNFTFSLPNDATDVGSNGLNSDFYFCEGLTSIAFPGLLSVTGSEALSYVCYGCTNLTSISFPELTRTSSSKALYYAFKSCTKLTSISFPKLTTISGGNSFSYAFHNCTKLTSISFPKLTTVSGDYGLKYAFYSCTALTSATFPELTTLSGQNALNYIFGNCTALQSVTFSKLTKISGNQALLQAFYSCTKLTSISFPKLTTTSFGSYKNQFQNMMQNTGSSYTHTIHFPSNLSSKISSLTGYPLFGGTSGKVVLKYDLAATS